MLDHVVRCTNMVCILEFCQRNVNTRMKGKSCDLHILMKEIHDETHECSNSSDECPHELDNINRRAIAFAKKLDLPISLPFKGVSVGANRGARPLIISA